MSDQRDDEDCIASFDSLESIFLAPDNSSTFHLGDEVNIRWYAGLLNGSAPGDESQSMEFNLILTTLQNSSYIFNLFQNTFLQFTKTPSDIEGITWSFTSTPDCPATEVSYNWTIPTTLPPFNAISDPDFIFIFESNQETGKASTQSPPFQIAFSPSPAPSSSSPSSSAPDSGITQILPSLPTDSSSPTPSSPYILSPGTKVAIAIGSIIGGLLSIAFGAWLSYIFLSRRSRRRKDPTMTAAAAAAADGSFSSKELAASPESEFMLPDARRESVISALPSPSPAPAPAPAQAEEKEFEIDSQPILPESGGSALFEMSSESRARARTLSASASASALSLSSRVVAAPTTMEMAVETVFFELDASEPVQRRDSASMKLPG
ncbi:hypothetical protein GGR50DRAFT_654480 [Xylaria sp. CBS 124048]|nr:hypothetical protein GGR50DRAFT_654480 [Xylaria sp. CBS 124048]